MNPQYHFQHQQRHRQHLAQDRASRLFLYRDDMAAEWAAYGVADAREITEAFVAGINAFITLTEREPALLPPEFSATGTRPARWEASDVVRVRSHAVVRNAEFEAKRARVLARADAKIDLARRSIDPPHDYVVPDGLDLDDIAARLKAAGAPVEWDDAIPGVRRFYTADAVGNRIEFIEEAA